MKILIQTNDPVLISFAEALLGAAGLSPFVADAHMSTMEGSLSILPRRVLIPEAEEDEARRLIEEAGYGAALVDLR